jgi:hypothetical protein
MANATTRVSSRALRSSRDLRPWCYRLACVVRALRSGAQDAARGRRTAPVAEPDGTEGAPRVRRSTSRCPGSERRAIKRRAAPTSEGPTTEAPAAAAGEEVDEEEPPPETTPRTPGVVGDTAGHFEPTEKVRADFDVSFPVDI